MKVYPRNVGDYILGAGLLSLVEHGALCLLLDFCYATEKPVPTNISAAYRICRAWKPSERAAVRSVLASHFTRTDDGYRNKRADEEIEAFHQKRTRLAQIGDRKWIEFRDQVFERDGHRCVYCGDEKGPFEADHVMPRSRGGSDDHSNLATACRSCNRSKSDRTPDEWTASR